MWEYYVHNWQRRAKVRTEDPFKLDAYPDRHDRFHCPRVRLPISMHPMVMARGVETTRFLLLQACYQYMEEIGNIEENLVIDINSKILDRSYMTHLDESYYQVLRSINIDEYFQGMASLSYRDQLRARTGCEPIEFRASSKCDELIRQSSGIQDSRVKELFEVTVLCLIEDSVSSSLLDYAKDDRCHDAFIDFNRRRLEVETFHSRFYRELLVTAHQESDVGTQESVARILPAFIRTCLHTHDEKRSYAHTLLDYCGLSSQQAETVVSETYPEPDDVIHFSTLDVAAARSLELLAQIPVYQRDDIKKCFLQYGFVL